MSKKTVLIIVAVLVFIGFRMCGGGDSISSIAGTYTLDLFKGGALKMEVLDDGRVRFEQHMTTTTGKVKEVVDGVFVVTYNTDIYLNVRTNIGGLQMGRGPLIFDTNENRMYWGYGDYEDRDITRVQYATFH